MIHFLTLTFTLPLEIAFIQTFPQKNPENVR